MVTASRCGACQHSQCRLRLVPLATPWLDHSRIRESSVHESTAAFDKDGTNTCWHWVLWRVLKDSQEKNLLSSSSSSDMMYVLIWVGFKKGGLTCVWKDYFLFPSILRLILLWMRTTVPLLLDFYFGLCAREPVKTWMVLNIHSPAQRAYSHSALLHPAKHCSQSLVDSSQSCCSVL